MQNRIECHADKELIISNEILNTYLIENDSLIPFPLCAMIRVLDQRADFLIYCQSLVDTYQKATHLKLTIDSKYLCSQALQQTLCILLPKMRSLQLIINFGDAELDEDMVFLTKGLKTFSQIISLSPLQHINLTFHSNGDELYDCDDITIPISKIINAIIPQHLQSFEFSFQATSYPDEEGILELSLIDTLLNCIQRWDDLTSFTIDNQYLSRRFFKGLNAILANNNALHTLKIGAHGSQLDGLNMIQFLQHKQLKHIELRNQCCLEVNDLITAISANQTILNCVIEVCTDQQASISNCIEAIVLRNKEMIRKRSKPEQCSRSQTLHSTSKKLLPPDALFPQASRRFFRIDQSKIEKPPTPSATDNTPEECRPNDFG